jgi:hypothetical protein
MIIRRAKGTGGKKMGRGREAKAQEKDTSSSMRKIITQGGSASPEKIQPLFAKAFR